MRRWMRWFPVVVGLILLASSLSLAQQKPKMPPDHAFQQQEKSPGKVTFSHDKPMPWFLPNVRATDRRIDVDFVVVVQFRGDKIACERIYWDHATVLRQVGLLGG